MSIDDHALRNTRRTPTPRRLPSAPPGDGGDNATVREDFRLYYPATDVRAGTRCRVEDAGGGLARFSQGDTQGALCEARHFLLDEDVRRGS